MHIKDYLDKREQELNIPAKSRSVTPIKNRSESNNSLSALKKTPRQQLRVVKDAQNSPIGVSVDKLRKNPVAFIVPFSNHKIQHTGGKGRSRTPDRSQRIRKRGHKEVPVKQVSRKEQVDQAQMRLKRIKDYDKEMRNQLLNSKE